MHNSVLYIYKHFHKYVRKYSGYRSILLLLTLGSTTLGLTAIATNSASGESLPSPQLNFPQANFSNHILEVSQNDLRSAIPSELSTILSQVDTAANARSTSQLTLLYTGEFTNSDNLDRDKMLEALTALWKRYPNLNYRTEVQSWEYRAGGFTVETVTNISGTTEQDGTTTKFQSTLRSRQIINNLRITNQEILAEKTQITIGSNPPTVRINLPEQVRVGQQYSFDAIVQEPLGDDLILGAALEEAVSRDRYLNPADLELNLLQSGGIFKVGRAPLRPEPRWISAVLIRGGGTTVITQRLRVVD
jgi:hypothetical protein